MGLPQRSPLSTAWQSWIVKFLPSVKRGERHKHGGERALGAILSRVQDEGDAQLRAEIAALSRFWIADGMVFGKAA
jgi:hypothetical protein